MNLQNQLTRWRLVVVVPFVWLLSVDWHWSKTIALVLFLVASFTDYADGYIARRYRLGTVFGQLMDPLVDKIMIVSAFICLVPSKDLPAWTVIIIVSRQFLITVLPLISTSPARPPPPPRP